MKYEDIKESLELFDDFVQKALSGKTDQCSPMEVVKAYNVIRDFINKNIEFADNQDNE